MIYHPPTSYIFDKQRSILKSIGLLSKRLYDAVEGTAAVKERYLGMNTLNACGFRLVWEPLLPTPCENGKEIHAIVYDSEGKPTFITADAAKRE